MQTGFQKAFTWLSLEAGVIKKVVDLPLHLYPHPAVL